MFLKGEDIINPKGQSVRLEKSEREQQLVASVTDQATIPNG